jgi:hypothetical protein
MYNKYSRLTEIHRQHLDAICAIYSPEAKSHGSIHSSSAAEEQRREGHHLREERVELVY